MSDYNPTDDELRAIADDIRIGSWARDLARLVLREREALTNKQAAYDGAMAGAAELRTRAERAEAERVQARAALRAHVDEHNDCFAANAEKARTAEAALARVEALPERFDLIASNCSYGAPDAVTEAWLEAARQVRAAIAGEAADG